MPELHIRNLSTLISRAAKYGIRVFLYFQPVRSVAAENREFWNRHSECAGQREKATEQVLDANKDQLIDMICLCTSVPAVKQWIADASAQLAEKLPELGGMILITAANIRDTVTATAGKKTRLRGLPSSNARGAGNANRGKSRRNS